MPNAKYPPALAVLIFVDEDSPSHTFGVAPDFPLVNMDAAARERLAELVAAGVADAAECNGSDVESMIERIKYDLAEIMVVSDGIAYAVDARERMVAALQSVCEEDGDDDAGRDDDE